MDRDMAYLTQGFVDSVVSQVKETLAQVEDLDVELRDLTATASSPDRLVTVVVAPQGKIVKLTLDPRIYREHDSASLAAKILDTIAAARSDVDEQENELRQRLVPSVEALGNSVGFDVAEISGPIMAAFGKDSDDDPT